MSSWCTDLTVLQYGGKYAPQFAVYFEQQNRILRQRRSMSKKHIPINIATLGIVNGCVDMYAQAQGYPHQAYNNTYDLHTISEEDYDQAMTNITKPNGLFDLTAECRRLEQQLDPQQFGNIDVVNQACLNADNFATTNLLGSYGASQVNGTRSDSSIQTTAVRLTVLQYDIYDITQYPTVTFPLPYLVGFFNQHWVQAALGTPVNFTVNSNVVSDGMLSFVPIAQDCSRYHSLFQHWRLLD
jgi:hypothetical protein